MLYLYHGTTSVCAIKVRLTITEKALPWEGEVLWLQRGDQYRPDYLELNPNAVVQSGAAAAVITGSSMAWLAEIAKSLSQFASLSAGDGLRERCKQHDRSSC
jgi:hypothetical protein